MMGTLSDAVAMAEKVPGWMNRVELEWLGMTACGLQPGAGWVEMGTYVGRSLLVTALCLPHHATLVSIDKTAFAMDKDGVRLEHIIPRIVSLRPDLRMVLMRADTLDAVPMLRLEPDVVFIDAGHTYENTAREIRDAIKMVKPGGRVCGHDYNQKDWPGVVQAVDELAVDAKVIPGGSIWYTPPILKVRI